MRIGLVGVGRIGAFHAATLKGLPAVDQVVVADADASRAELVAKDLGLEYAPDVDALLASGVDGFVIAAATDGARGPDRGRCRGRSPTFCEKPVADRPRRDPARGRAGRGLGRAGAHRLPAPVRRRVPGGRARPSGPASSASIHHIRANTNDAFPPPQEYIPTSGGFFRDCTVHDFDIIRYVTGREVSASSPPARTAARRSSASYGDVDAAAACSPSTTTPFVSVSGTRYNAAGHDVRMEVLGSLGSLAVGLDEHTALRSAEAGVTFPGGQAHATFMDRFRAGVRRRADRLHRGRRRHPRGPVHGPGRLPGLPDRRRLRALPPREPPRVSRRAGMNPFETVSSTPSTLRCQRRSADD